MKQNIYLSIAVAFLALGTVSCSEEPMQPDNNSINGKNKMEFLFNHPDATRATETSFEKDDVVGVFVNKSSKPLEIAGNVVNNERFQFNGNAWTTSRPLYWDPGTFNVTAYYPFVSDVLSISDLDFEVKTDQRDSQTDGLSPYEASDFLFANTKGVTASANPVSLQFKHILSKLTIRLIKGEDFEGEMPETALVQIHNTVTKATVDLEAGIATKYPRGERKTIIAKQTAPTYYSAIIIPQRLDNRVPLIEVIMNGVSYLYESKFVFKPGTHHIVSLVIDSNPDQLKIEIGGEITNWF